MFLSDLPTRVKIVWAASAGGGFVRPIPVASQIGVTPGAASFTDGFPPDTFDPIASGGQYVDGRDENGILQHLSAWTRWQAAGGAATYNSTFATDIGGYPKLAQLASRTSPGVLWVSTVDANTTDPDGVGAANWVGVGPVKATTVEAAAGTDDTKFITPFDLHTVLGEVVPQAASLPEAQAGLNGVDYISPAVLAGLFSLTDGNGSLVLPSGLILKMGRKPLITGSNVTRTPLNFPTPFPSNVIAIVGNADGDCNPGRRVQVSLNFRGFSATGGYIDADSGQSGEAITNPGLGAYWIAIGK